jgi:hypothetical protein
MAGVWVSRLAIFSANDIRLTMSATRRSTGSVGSHHGCDDHFVEPTHGLLSGLIPAAAAAGFAAAADARNVRLPHTALAHDSIIFCRPPPATVIAPRPRARPRARMRRDARRRPTAC